MLRIDYRGYKEVELHGNALGYMSASKYLFEALGRSEEVEFSDDAEIALHFCNPRVFKPVAGKKNVLYTMCESNPAPSYHMEPLLLGNVDLQIVPSKFCYDALIDMCRETGVPMEVATLGFDPDAYPYVERSWSPGERFNFLWIGAPNGRKGMGPVSRAWDLGFADQDFASVIFKTTDPKGEGKLQYLSDNCIFDSRFVSREELQELVRQSHCAVLPSHAEGFGLVHLECLATGMPVITVKHSAQVEFLKDDALYAEFQMRKIKTSDGEDFNAAVTNEVDLMRQMAKVIKKYSLYLKRAKRGSDRVHKTRTWKQAAKETLAAIKDFTNA